MNFKSKILNNTKVSKDYFDGDYKFDFLPKIVGVQYAITDTVEELVIDAQKTNRFEKFTDLESFFIKLINFLNKNEFENYKVKISQKLSDESLKHWKPEKIENERKRLCNEIYLDSIGIEWRKDFWDFENDEIIYNERYEITLGFIDEKYRNVHTITVEINPENLEVDDAFFE